MTGSPLGFPQATYQARGPHSRGVQCPRGYAYVLTGPQRPGLSEGCWRCDLAPCRPRRVPGLTAAQATRQPRPQRGHTSPLPEATLLLAVCPGSHAVCASVRRRCSHRSDVQGVAMKRSVLVETCGGPEGAAVSPNHPRIPQRSPAAPCSPPPSPEVPRRPPQWALRVRGSRPRPRWGQPWGATGPGGSARLIFCN